MCMTSTKKGFNELLDYLMKLEGLMQAGKLKMLGKKPHIIGNFSRSYSKGRGQQAYLAHSIHSALPAYMIGPAKVSSPYQVIGSQGVSYSTTSQPFLEQGCYYYGIVVQFKRECHLRQVNAQVQ